MRSYPISTHDDLIDTIRLHPHITVKEKALSILSFNGQDRSCHAERSEASLPMATEMLSAAKHDRTGCDCDCFVTVTPGKECSARDILRIA
jgi:hypothetical protein